MRGQKEMGDVWFDVLSDFWPHGRVSSTYGVLRGDYRGWDLPMQEEPRFPGR